MPICAEVARVYSEAVDERLIGGRVSAFLEQLPALLGVLIGAVATYVVTADQVASYTSGPMGREESQCLRRLCARP